MRLKPRHWVLAGVCLTAFGVMAGLSINYWMAGKWYLADVGNVNHCLINTWFGRFMWSPLMASNHFGVHFTPFWFLLLPIVWLSAYPVPLVLAYQAALALTPVPIYMLARHRGLPPAVALATGGWFLGNHFFGSLQLAQHFENFYVLLAMFAMAFIYAPQRHGWWLCAVGALSVKEDAAVWMLGFAVWALLFEREPMVKRRAGRLAGLCLIWGVAAAGIMAFSARGQESNVTGFFERMGSLSLGADNLRVLGLLVLSSGAVCLINWRAALLLLIPVPVILGEFMFTRQLLYYYSYPFLPFLAFATVAGLGVIWQKWPRKNLAVGMVLGLVTLGAVQYVLPTRTDGYRRLPVAVTPRDDMRRHVAAEILPRDVPLALQFGLWGVTPWREETVFLRDDQLQDHHYVFMDLQGIHGLSPEDNRTVLFRLRDEVAEGRREELYDAYDFMILSPVKP